MQRVHLAHLRQAGGAFMKKRERTVRFHNLRTSPGAESPQGAGGHELAPAFTLDLTLELFMIYEC